MPFSQEVRTRTLLWCDRHCCLCKKACGVNIEVHHLIPQSKGGSDEIDNAIPLCFECHSEVERYNSDHPIGTKYKVEELKIRREQVYEEFTRHLVPPVHYEITQMIPGRGKRTFPDVGFTITHLSDSLPVQLRIIIASQLMGSSQPIPSEHYSGKKLWNLNPRSSFSGHFKIPDSLVPQNDNLELRVTLSIIDQYGREHSQLSTGHIYMPERNDWYAEP